MSDAEKLFEKFGRQFPSGTVIFADTDECAKGAKVTLKGDGVSKSVDADGFGDFWFEGLDAKTNFVLEVEADGYKKIEHHVSTLNDINVGELFLEK